MTIELNKVSRELLGESLEKNRLLKASISEFKKNETQMHQEAIFDIFLNAMNLQEDVNGLLHLHRKNDQILKLKESAKKTIDYMFQCLAGSLSENQITDLMSKQRYICFLDTSSCIYANDYPCRFEFEGKTYHSATACYLAAQFVDQPKIMQLFIECKNAKEALQVAEQYNMTFDRQKFWNIHQYDLLMRILREKFGQNFELRDQLLSTGHAYIVCHDTHPTLSDGFDGTGKNALGRCLMHLREEYEGIGEVFPSISYQMMTQAIKTSRVFPLDLLHHIFLNLDNSTLLSAGCACKSWNRALNFLLPKISQDQLQKICPMLTVIDAKTSGSTVDDESAIKNLQVLKWIHKAGSQIKDGVTLLTLEKGLTLNKIIREASEIKMHVEIGDGSIKKNQTDIALEASCRVLLINNVILDCGRFKQIKVLKKTKCEMLELLQSITLCVRTLKVRKIYFKDNNRVFTFGTPPSEFKFYNYIGDFNINTI